MARGKNHKSLDALPKNLERDLPPLIYAAQSKGEEARITRLKRAKKIRKIGPRLYTSLPKNEVENFVRRQWGQIVSRLYPNVVLSHRSALEYGPSPDNKIFLTSTTNREVKFPGLTLEFVRGPAALEDDMSYLDFHASSPARAFLENFSATKATQSRVLTAEQIELRLNEILRLRGEDELNRIRDRARTLATELKWQREFGKLDRVIGALLGTNKAHAMKSAEGRARAKGKPYDATRLARFDLLLSELRSSTLPELKPVSEDNEHRKNKAFFEAYFSNYIEGTTFEIDEAEEIVFDKKIPATRPKDAHDILGTFNIVSDISEMRKVPTTAQEFLSLMARRHQILMADRPEARPGQLKGRPNRAGDSHFVHPDEVEGTIEQGFSRYLQLPEGLARAIFAMFLVAEIHPFTDGNGRVARIMMNAEMHSRRLSTIIIPNVYREDYLGSLRTLTRQDRPKPIVKMLTRAQVFSNLNFESYSRVLKEIRERNWFKEPSDAKIIDS